MRILQYHHLFFHSQTHQFLHLAAEDDSYREAVFSKAAWALCNALETNSGPIEPHQLGLSRYVLLDIAVERYVNGSR